MAVALETVVKQLTDSGIIAQGQLERFVPPKAQPKDADELIAQLVKENHLTKFQAAQVAAGKSKSLILGGYTILDKIGAGGMGQVFKAHNRRMDRLVAIKMLPPAMTRDTSAVARFEREVRAAAKLRHTNIVAADDADQANGVHFLVMEYVEGKDLSVLVKKNGPFPVAKATNYILQAARGLEFAHKRGVIHRDIKPANLLLDHEGTVKILDMGLARIETDGNVAAQAELTGTGTIMGTVDYMAPEQGMSTKHADARADIYSLGCSLYYLIAGKATYEGETMAAKLVAHHTQAIPNLRTVHPNVSEQLEAVFKKMVAKRIEDRYQTMTEVIADLERLGGNSGTINNPIEATAVFDNQDFSFLKNAVATPKPAKAKAAKKEPVAKNVGQGKQPPGKNTKVLIGAAFLGVLILAGIIVSLQTKDGALIVEVDQPDAMVQVLDAEGKVEVSQKGGGGKIAISVDPGKHRLRVEKNGFVVFGQEFEIESGGNKAITAKLVPVKVEVAAQPNQPWNTPAFQAWKNSVQAMPAEQQVQAVSRKLVELNPTFDGKVSHKADGNVVYELNLKADHIIDISPVRALSMLRRLECRGSAVNSGRLADLTPLEGMQLESLRVFATKVNDLTPLRGVPLKELSISMTPVVDLIVAKELPLTTLECSDTKIADFSPLKETRIRSLTCSFDVERDANVLLSIKSLEAINKKSRDQFIKDLPGEREVAAVIKKLQEANPGFDGRNTHRVDNGIVRELQFYADYVRDISPVRVLTQLDSLACTGKTAKSGRLTDLSPLQGMQLMTLDVGATQVTDVSPLKGMPLVQFKANHSQFGDAGLEQLKSLKTLNSVSVLQTKVTVAGVESLQKALPNCKVDWNDPAKATTATPNFNDPAFQQWMKDVAALPAERQVQAVASKLVELNPGFDGKTTPKINNGVITEILFATDNVTDISPIRALTGLKVLKCDGFRPGKSKLSDLSPLHGMLLANLSCSKTQVSDIAPLQGMPLTILDLSLTKVSDLSPLEGMLLETLHCQLTQVTDLSPLQGMALKYLDFSGAKVSSLAPLTKMPLTNLGCLGSQVSDLSPLEDSESLVFLHVGNTKVTASGVAALQAKLPNCKITWDDPGKATTPAAPLGPQPPLAKTPYDAAQAKAHQAAWAKYLGTQVETANSVGAKMVLIPPGEFLMGSSDEQVEEALKVADEIKADQRIKDQIQKSERPQHRVIITKPFLMGATEVTVGQFKKFSATGYQTGAEKAEIATKAAGVPATLPPPKPILTYLNPGYTVTDDSPAAFISWNEAVAYCRWLSDQEQTVYRLPTEAEWEYACRAGTTTQYSFGDDHSLLDQYGWYQKNAGGTAHLVGTKTANGFGLFDMHGNMEEWCRDFYDEKWYDKTSVYDPTGPLTGSYPVIRGGSWNPRYTASHCRTALRIPDHSPSNRFDATGFRIVRELAAPSTTASVTPQPAVPAAASSKLFMHDPAFPQWLKDVQAMTAEKQIEAVSKKLVELNPGFDGVVTSYDGTGTPKIENAVVTELGIITVNVTDISPVRALEGLSVLKCGGVNGNGKLSDLSPLTGMRLTKLVCYHSEVSDLSPLRGMPLTWLECGKTKVSDLSPLHGMKLTMLTCHSTQVSDLTPLRGMPLTIISCDFKASRDAELLRSIKTLKRINDKPAAEFWKEVDAK